MAYNSNVTSAQAISAYAKMYRPYGTSFGDGARAGINKLPGNLGVNSGARLNWYGGTEIALQKGGNATLYTFTSLPAGSYYIPLEAVGQSFSNYFTLGDNGESRYLQYKLNNTTQPDGMPLNVIGKNAGGKFVFTVPSGVGTCTITMCGYDGFDRKVVGVCQGPAGVTMGPPGFFNKITSIFITLNGTATINWQVHRGGIAWDVKPPYAWNTLNVPGAGGYHPISAGYPNPPFVNNTAYLNIYKFIAPSTASIADNYGITGTVQFWNVSHANGSGSIEQNMNVFSNNQYLPTTTGFPADGFQPSEVRTALTTMPNYNLNWTGWNG